MMAPGLVAHVLVSRFVDHLPYYRKEDINARSNVHTPRSTLASWSGQGGAGLRPLFDVHRERILGADVLHADETWASWHIQGGTPLNVLQELGGWASYSMVQRYAHLAADHLAPWADRLPPASE